MNFKNYIFDGLIVLTVILGSIAFYLLHYNEQAIDPVPGNDVNKPAAVIETENKTGGYDAYKNRVSIDLLKIEPRIILRLHGSNTIGGKLIPAMAASFLQQLGAEATITKPLKQLNESQVIGYLPHLNEVVAIEIKAHGSSTGFKSLINQTADIAMSSRPIKHEENLKLIIENGDMTKPESEHIVALDGLAIVVHPDNPLQNITVNQLAEIFSGKITDWSQLQGEAGTINLYARDNQSGTFDTFKTLILEKFKLDLAKSQRFESNAELVNAVRNDRSGIGFSGLAYAANDMILRVAADTGLPAIIPNQFTISSEDYPLSRRLYLYTNKNKTTNPYLIDFINYSVSGAGQQLAEKENFIAQKITTQLPNDISEFPSEYQKMIKHAERLSMTFRMRADRAEIDNKSAQDIENLVAFLSTQTYEKIRLIGFSAGESNDEVMDRNRALLRSKLLALELKQRGVRNVEVAAFGEQMPIDSNNDSHGVYRNNRTEVWLVKPEESS
ncbi:MAG: substrate-binding domain-containing protein [Marinicella sp.]|nr:substrate-binding domain-containing protein [Xanthomonadales bacterium]